MPYLPSPTRNPYDDTTSERPRGGRFRDRFTDRFGGWAGRNRYDQPTGLPAEQPTRQAPTAPPATLPGTPGANIPAPGIPVQRNPTTARGATIDYNEGYAGSCVNYALDRFHQTTGVYPQAFGDARFLATGAASAGWATGETPRINALAVFQPGQNGATGPTGHAAWVEQINAGQIYISEMNAPTPFVVTRRWLTPAPGVRFIYTD